MRFAFFATRTDHLRDPRRVFSLTSADIARFNPNTRTLPVFRTYQDAELTRAIYERVPVLVREGNEEEGEGKADPRHASLNPWGVRFLTMFQMANDSHLFRTRTELEGEGYRLVGNVFVRESGAGSGEWGKLDSRLPTPDSRYLPLYEGKMIWQYDHRFGTFHGVSNRSNTHLPTPDAAQHAEPDFVVIPWYWVPAGVVQQRLNNWQRGWLLVFRDIADATNERTAIFSLLPRVGTNNALQLVTVQTNTLLAACWYANVNSITFDFVTRQKVGGTSVSLFILRQLPVLPPTAYTAQDIAFIVPRLLELTYTTWDMAPFAADVWRELGEGNGEWGKQMREEIIRQWEACHEDRLAEIITAPDSSISIPPFRWDEERRAILRAELDAYYARLYGLTRKQLRYILDPADLTPRELTNILDPWEEVRDPLDPTGYAARVAQSDFPGETFRVLKKKEQRQCGEYRTRRLVLEAWERLTR
jgi:hypothetical protein